MDSIYIIKAENAGNLTVSLTFSDNTKQVIDVGDFIRRHPHPQYNKYLDPRKFSRFISAAKVQLFWNNQQIFAGKIKK